MSKGLMRAEISIKNISGFDAALDEVISAVSSNLEQVADIVFQDAKTTTEFRDKTGLLRRKIKLEKSKFDEGFIVAARAPHAHLVEFGHAKFLWGHPTGERVAAHPFLRPAKEKGLIKAISIFRNK